MTDIKLTEAELLELEASKYERSEIIEGKVIPLAPTEALHGLILGNITFCLGGYNRQHKLGRVFGAETGFYTRGDEKTVRAPDVAFVSYTTIPAGELPNSFLAVAPELIAEVVSPGDRAGEIEQKTREWLDFGVKLVWVVYPDTQRVYVYTTGNQVRVLGAADQINGGDVLPNFENTVKSFFED